MKKSIKLLSLFLGLTLATGVSVSFASNKEVKRVSAVGNYSTNASTYYNSITATSGKELAAQLHDLITSTHGYYTSYADNGANGLQKQTDQYYENGQKVSGYIYEFYSGVKWPNAWAATSGSTTGGYNREHCWCQSLSGELWGESGGGADMHHLRPVEVRLNSTRGNNLYGELSSRDSYKVYAKYGTNATYALGGYNNGGVFEPLDNKKGDVARIILYTYLHYNSYNVSSLFGSYGTTNGSGSSSYFKTSLLPLTNVISASTEAKALELLLEWNISDPVDEIEQRRNEQVAIYQGNRNPFIDNSNYADMIWGNGGSTDPMVTSVSVSPTSLNLDLNGTTTGNLTATVNVLNGAPQTVTWTSDNTNVATVSSGGVVTAVAKGTCTITATSTYNSNKSASCTVKVTDSSGGGGGGGTVTGNFTWNLAIASYDSNPTEELVTWSHDYATMESIRVGSNTKANNYLGGDSNNRTSSRFYSGNTLRITPASNYTITSVVFTATNNNYATALGNSTWTNASASASSTTVTVTPTNGANAFSASIGGTCGFTAVQVNYSTESGGSTATLSSISLNTSNVQTEFYTGDTFDYSGLMVTAHYSDGTEDIVNPSNVSSPTMSSAGNKTVTITYTENNVTKTADYTITVVDPEVTAIYAYVVDKTYHPGETISSNDISVEDDLGNAITTFTFTNDGYQFTYADAPSGGNDGTKIFANSISYSTFTADLEVTVNRINRYNPVSYDDTMTRSWTGINSNQYTAWSNKSGSSGANYAGKSAKYSTNSSDAIQLRSSGSDCGIVTTAYSGSLYISSISVSWNSGTENGRTLNIYGDTTAYTSASQLYGNSIKGTLLGTIVYGTSTSLTIAGSYKFIGIRSAANALYLDEIVVTYGSSDSATNLANYIMYEDTTNQCLTKFDIAKGYFEGLTTAERASFMADNGYVISTARTRLQAWADYLGKVIVSSNDDYVITNKQVNLLTNITTSNSLATILVVSISVVALVSIGGYFFLRKKEDK